MSLTGSERTRRCQNKKKALGLCVSCNERAVEDSRYCPIHRFLASLRLKRHREKRKRMGLCLSCGKPADRGVSCFSCCRKQEESKRKTDRARRQAGVCRECGGRLYKASRCFDHWLTEKRRVMIRASGSLDVIKSDLGRRIKEIYETETCHWCREFTSVTTRTIDHVHPVSLGGTDNPGNLVMACKSCNCKKGSLPLDRWLLKLSLGGVPSQTLR